MVVMMLSTHWHIIRRGCRNDLRSVGRCRRLLNDCRASGLRYKPSRRRRRLGLSRLLVLRARRHHQSHRRAVQLTQLLRTNLTLLRRRRHNKLLARVRRQEALCLRTLRPDHHSLGRRNQAAHVLDLQQRVVRGHHQPRRCRHNELMLTDQVDGLQNRLAVWQQNLLMGRLRSVGRQYTRGLCRLSAVRQYGQLGDSRAYLEALRVLRRCNLNEGLLLVVLVLWGWLGTQEGRRILRRECCRLHLNNIFPLLALPLNLLVVLLLLLLCGRGRYNHSSLRLMWRRTPQTARLHKLLCSVAVVNQLANHLLAINRRRSGLHHLVVMLLLMLLLLYYRSVVRSRCTSCTRCGSTRLEHKPSGQRVQHCHRAIIRQNLIVMWVVLVMMLAQPRRTDNLGRLPCARINYHWTSGRIRNLNRGARRLSRHSIDRIDYLAVRVSVLNQHIATRLPVSVSISN